MKAIIAILLVILLWGCVKTKENENEKLYHQAFELLQEECTNDIVGLTRIINAQFDSSVVPLKDENPTNWVPDIDLGYTNLYAQCGTADATIEHINSVGGIERTNIPFVFQWVKYGISINTNLADLECIPDYQKIADQEAQEFKEQSQNADK